MEATWTSRVGLRLAILAAACFVVAGSAWYVSAGRPPEPAAPLLAAPATAKPEKQARRDGQMPPAPTKEQGRKTEERKREEERLREQRKKEEEARRESERRGKGRAADKRKGEKDRRADKGRKREDD